MRSLSLIALVLAAGPVAAQYTYEWNYQGTFLANNATLTPTAGPTFSLDLYIHETGATNTLATNHLFAAGARATYTNPTGSVAVANTAGITPNAAFNDSSAFTPSVSNAGAGPYFAQFTEASTNTNTTTVGPDANKRILLGTFLFTVNGTQSSTLTAASLPTSDPLSPANILGSYQGAVGGGVSIDSLITSSTLTISPNPVPEPASVLLVGAAGMGVVAGARRWRRRRAAV